MAEPTKNTFTLNLPSQEYETMKTLADLDGLSATEYIRRAIKHYAPISVLQRRSPLHYFTIMQGVTEMAEGACFTMTKLGTDEQNALGLSSVDALREHWKKQANEILDRIGCKRTGSGAPVHPASSESPS